ncbi:MAG: S41 family peptidase [Bacteroidaceae bacterium]|nr:S41 family peptidase [Bacteroidaceae bacterium]
MNKGNHSRFMPLILALCMVVGVLIGAFYASHFSGNRLNISNASSNKLNNLLHIIGDQYVDTVNMEDLVEKSMPRILAELDPHSTYVTASDMESNNDDLKGSFSGVGISFTIRDDTLHIQNIISNGPAEKAGIVAGDKIVRVDGKPFVGEECNDVNAMKRLKGPKGTKVELGIIRYGESKIRTFTVTRDDIVQKSVSCSYMIDDKIGYIRLKNFGETTYPEMLVALARLNAEGVENLIIDLRDNTGGYFASAVQIANEFLSSGKLIVYTKGRKSPREEYRSDGHGSYQKIPLIVLINEGSASSSEILAGAIQDNDRGTVIGRRSFGKGLVQQPIQFHDGSMVRLTIARYYTPSGRCIQKPYEKGNERDYEQDLVQRYQRGEFFSQDSIKNEGPEYHTSNGRIVYGGGGITPDIFVPEDTSAVTSYYAEAVYSGIIFTFAYNYTDENRNNLNHFDNITQMASYLKRQGIVEKFAQYANNHGLKRRNLMIRQSNNLLERMLISRIIYNMMDESALYEYLNQDDDVIRSAMQVLNEKKSFPKNEKRTKK